MKLTNRIIQYNAYGSKKIYFDYYVSALNKLIWLNHTQAKHPDITTELQSYGGKGWYTVGIANNGRVEFTQN